MPENTKKVGIALGGGAFRGLAHIGVLEVLEDAGVPIDLVAGTSMGSVIGGIYATGFSMKLLERYCYTIDEREMIDMVVPREGMIAGDRIKTLLCTLTGNRTFDQLQKPFAALAADIENAQPVVLKEGLVYEAMRCSISVPGVFKPVRKDGKLMVDGGVVARVPTDVVRDMGADFIISVDVGYHGGYQKVEGIANVMMQAFAVMEWYCIKDKVNTSDVNIVADTSNINLASIAQAEQTVEIGRQAALACLDEIKEKLQQSGIALLK